MERPVKGGGTPRQMCLMREAHLTSRGHQSLLVREAAIAATERILAVPVKFTDVHHFPFFLLSLIIRVAIPRRGKEKKD